MLWSRVKVEVVPALAVVRVWAVLGDRRAGRAVAVAVVVVSATVSLLLASIVARQMTLD